MKPSAAQEPAICFQRHVGTVGLIHTLYTERIFTKTETH